MEKVIHYFFPAFLSRTSFYKGADCLSRNKYMIPILVLCIFLLIILVVNVFLHIRIHIVYSSGVGPFLLIGLIIMAIVILYVKGYQKR
jgi:hypothetical protein